MKKHLWIACVLLVMAGAIVAAHVTVGPTESKLGASERYTVRVPTEGQVATVGVDLEVPEGVAVSYVLASSGWTSEVKRVERRIVGISWKVEIPPAHFGELVFTARNPKEGTGITWKIKQRFADGTSSDWTANTKLVPPAAPAAR
jgi:uncharacterized protein YcnI